MGIDLVTLQEYKTYAGINNPNQDTQISSIIPKVSAFVKNHCRRTFVDYVDEVKTEVFSGGLELYPQELPIIAIQGLEYSSDYGKTYVNLVEYTDWVYDQVEGAIKPIQSSAFSSAINGYKLSYTAGYEVLPEDLKIAVMDLVTYYLKGDFAIHSTKAPGTNSTQIEFISSNSLPAHISRVLDLYIMNYN